MSATPDPLYDLAVLAISLLPPDAVRGQPAAGTPEQPAAGTPANSRDAAESTAKVRFELQGHVGKHITSLGEFKIAARDLGVPRYLSWEKVRGRGGYDFRLPSDLTQWVCQAVEKTGVGRGTLWVHLVTPYGYLGMFPWEPTLRPVVGCRILRLPDYVVDPPKQTSAVVDVALCCPTNSGKAPPTDLVARIAGAIASAGARSVRLAIFADSLVAKRLRSEQPSSFEKFKIHALGEEEPSTANPSFITEYIVNPVSNYVSSIREWLRSRSSDDLLLQESVLRRAVDPVTSPWLRKVRRSLGARSVDAVHFIADGTMYSDRGALLLDEGEVNSANPEPHIVSAAELLSFQAQVGAWAMGFSSAPDNFSDMGLRQFADTLAQLRPGPLLYQDARDDLECAALRDAYAFLFADAPADPPALPAVFMYCEPFRVRDPRYPDATFESLSASRIESDAFLPEEGRLRTAFQHADNVPSWVAASERFVDMYKKRLVELGRSGEKTPAELNEIRGALTRIQNIIAKTGFAGKIDL
jgi:hypothetical protein